jgi:predicted enzyme related to lactoylglutathione lyase
MSDATTATKAGPNVGTVGWHDLTVPNADEVRTFYEAVVGWTSSPVGMGDYSDFSMVPPGTDQPVAGICHARGGNANVPAQWLLYFIVADVDASVRACVERGGEVISGPREAGGGKYCVIKDPAGAVCALYQA